MSHATDVTIFYSSLRSALSSARALSRWLFIYVKCVYLSLSLSLSPCSALLCHPKFFVSCSRSSFPSERFQSYTDDDCLSDAKSIEDKMCEIRAPIFQFRFFFQYDIPIHINGSFNSSMINWTLTVFVSIILLSAFAVDLLCICFNVNYFGFFFFLFYSQFWFRSMARVTGEVVGTVALAGDGTHTLWTEWKRVRISQWGNKRR